MRGGKRAKIHFYADINFREAEYLFIQYTCTTLRGRPEVTLTMLSEITINK